MTHALPIYNELQEQALYKRVMWRIMPIIIAIYFVAIVDKSNVGFAKLQMISGLGLTEQAFAFGSSLFFIGLLIFEIPSSLLAKRFGLRIWVTRILLTWAAITWAMVFVQEVTLFNVLRFLLGVAEAGLYPAILFYTACWFPTRYRAQAFGLMTLGSALGNGFGAIVSGSLLDMTGLLGLQGWQWLFVVTGAMPLLVAIVVWFFLPSQIADAKFLSQAEKDRIERDVSADAAPELGSKTFTSVFWDPRVLVLSAGFIVVLTALMGLIYWLPTVIYEFDVSGTALGLLSALPWGFVAIALIVIPPYLSTSRRVDIATSILGGLGALLFLVSILAEHNWLRLAAVCLATPCISLLLTCFWTHPAKYFAGTRAAAAIAVVATYGNLGGFFAQNLMPWAAEKMGYAAGGLIVPMVCLLLTGLGGAILLLINGSPSAKLGRSKE